MTKISLWLVIILILCYALSLHSVLLPHNPQKFLRYDDNDLILTLSAIPFNTYDDKFIVTGKLQTLSTFRALEAEVQIDFPYSLDDPTYSHTEITLHAQGIIYSRATLKLIENAGADLLVWLLPVEDHIKVLDVYISTTVITYPSVPKFPHFVSGMMTLCVGLLNTPPSQQVMQSDYAHQHPQQHTTQQQHPIQQLRTIQAFYISYITHPFAKIFHYNSYCSNDDCTVADSFEIYIRSVLYPNSLYLSHSTDPIGPHDPQHPQQGSIQPHTTTPTTFTHDITFAFMSGGQWQGLVPDTLQCIINDIPIDAIKLPPDSPLLLGSSTNHSLAVSYPVFLFRGIEWEVGRSYKISCTGIAIHFPPRYHRLIPRITLASDSIPYYQQISNYHSFSSHYAPMIHITSHFPMLMHIIHTTHHGLHASHVHLPLLALKSKQGSWVQNRDGDDPNNYHQQQTTLVYVQLSATISIDGPIQATDRMVFCFDDVTRKNSSASPHNPHSSITFPYFSALLSQTILNVDHTGIIDTHQSHFSATMMPFTPSPPPQQHVSPSTQTLPGVSVTAEGSLADIIPDFELYRNRKCYVVVLNQFTETYRSHRTHHSDFLSSSHSPSPSHSHTHIHTLTPRGDISLITGKFNITLVGKAYLRATNVNVNTQHPEESSPQQSTTPSLFSSELAYYTTMKTRRGTVVSLSSNIQSVSTPSQQLAYSIQIQSEYTLQYAKDHSQTWAAPFDIILHQVYATTYQFDLLLSHPFWIDGTMQCEVETVLDASSPSHTQHQQNLQPMVISASILEANHYSNTGSIVDEEHIAPFPSNDDDSIAPHYRRVYRFQAHRLGHQQHTTTTTNDTSHNPPDHANTDHPIFKENQTYRIRCFETYITAHGHYNFRDQGVITILRVNDHDGSPSPSPSPSPLQPVPYQPIYAQPLISTMITVKNAELSPVNPMYFKKSQPISLTFILVASISSLFALCCLVFLFYNCPKRFSSTKDNTDDQFLTNSDGYNPSMSDDPSFGYPNNNSLNSMATDYFTFHNDDIKHQLIPQHQISSQLHHQQRDYATHRHLDPATVYLHRSPVDP